MNNFRIRGRIKGKRGGVFFGFFADTGKPSFGGSNLIYAPIWWSTTKEFVQSICDDIKKNHPDCECEVEQLTNN